MNSYAAWADPRLAEQVVRRRRDGDGEVALRVQSLEGAQQVLRLQQALQALPGVRHVNVDATARRVQVIWDTGRISLPSLLQVFASLRCAAQPLRRENINDTPMREGHDLLKRLLVAGMCAMQVMTYAFVIYIGAVDFVDFTTRSLFRWLSLLSTLPVVFYAANGFVRGAAEELRQRRLGIHLPVALAVWLVFLASTINTVRGSGEIYFDSVNMFVFLLLAARYVELRARHHSNALGDAVVDGTPLLSERRRADGILETVPAAELRPGDCVRVAVGAAVPVDGVLLSDPVSVDESLQTGESTPVARQRGETLAAGSLLLTGPAELRVLLGGEAMPRPDIPAMQARLARECASAGEQADLRRLVGSVLLLTAATALGWLWIDPSRAFASSVAVLVVACPCAFALTSPAALSRALGTLAQRGVLVSNSAALARLDRVDLVIMDKTGTLAIPQLDVGDIHARSGEDTSSSLALAAALARESSHPVARAISHAVAGSSTMHAEDVQVWPGGGISGRVSGRNIRLGAAEFALGQTAPQEDHHVWLADERGALASFRLREQPRADAKRTIDALRCDGIDVLMASGDAVSRVAGMAHTLEIETWHARLAPGDKLALLKEAHTQGHVALVVGDGSNDAPALAQADVSAAMATGTEAAQAQADLLLLHGRLHGLVEARAIARQVRHVTGQGRQWSLGYNLCVIPFAALGLVPPWLAAIGMSLSSLAVVLNALRIEYPHKRNPGPEA